MPVLDQINKGGTIYEIVPEIAELFSTTKVYHTGDHVIYEAGWYTFKADKSAGAWDATKVDGPFKVTDQLSDLKEDLSDVKDALVYAGIVSFGTFSDGNQLFTSEEVPIGTKIKYKFHCQASGVQYLRFLDENGTSLRNLGKTSSGASTTYTGEYVIPEGFSRCVAYCSSSYTLSVDYIYTTPDEDEFDKIDNGLNISTNYASDGRYVIPTSIIESGTISSNGEDLSSTTRIRTNYLIPIKSGYSFTFKAGSVCTHIYWYLYKTDGTGDHSYEWLGDGTVVNFDTDGVLRFVFRKTDTSATISPSDYDATVEIATTIANKVDDIYSISRNKISTPIVRGRINVDTGETYETPTSGGSYVTRDVITVIPEKQYTLSFDKTTFYNNIYYYGYSQNGSFIGRLTGIALYGISGQSITIQIPDNVYGIKIQFGDTSDTYTENIRENVQLEEGGVQTPYVNHKSVKSNAIDAYDIYDKLSKNSLFPDFVTVPGYYFENNYLPAKCDTINSYMDSSVANGDAFVFITDQHWEDNAKRSPALLRYIFDNTTVNLLFSGGDVYDGNHSYDYPTAREYMLKLRHGFPGKIYCCVGNHDYFKSMPSSRLSAIYDMYNYDYHGDPEKHYYYVDNKRAKIRYIVLADYYEGGSDNQLNGFTADTVQQTWFRDIALNLESGWGAVIITHQCWYNGATIANLTFDSRFKVPLIDVINNYNGAGEIICLIQGHTHVDRILHTDGENGKPVIITTCDKYRVVENPPDIYPSDRELGTIREQAFDVFVINRTSREINIVRVGCEAYDGVGLTNIGDAVQVRTVTY